MADYWRNALENCEHIPFPVLPLSVELPSPDSQIISLLPHIQGSSRGITPLATVHAAWALVAGQLTSSEDVVFGAAVPESSLSVAANATVPIRIKLAGEQTVGDYLTMVQKQATDRIPFEPTGSQQISETCLEAQGACMFQTLFTVHPEGGSAFQNGNGPHGSRKHQAAKTYALVHEVHFDVCQIRIVTSFDSRVISLWTVKQLLDRLKYVVRQLDSGDPNKKLRDIELVTPNDLKEIWKWNHTVPKPTERCIHEVFRERAQSQPAAPAIHAWDGQLTYGELEQHAAKLAGRLRDLGVGPGDLVPLIFEKSMWTSVAILAVLEGGGGFVLVDPSLPKKRIQEIARQIKAKLALTSISAKSVGSQLADQTLTISSDFFTSLEPSSHDGQHRGKVSPSSIAYVVFTSGSTGAPKGAMISHRNIVSVIPRHIEVLGYAPHSRVYDFASYSFTMSIHTVLSTLIAGACLCVPSENDRRNNLASSLASFKATIVSLTPSLAGSLSPHQVPDLQALMFGGEAVREKDVMPWRDRVKVMVGYGCSEVASAAIINPKITRLNEASRIGKGSGNCTWVVDPDNHDKLLPLGCIGELLLEGPAIGSGYLNDPSNTAAAFIESPTWLSRGAPGHKGRHGRMYKTGDLVQYNEDGSLSYFGRNDAQVKIRGQRVELGEVEHQVQQHMPQAKQVVAEVIVPQAQRPTPILAVFLRLRDGAPMGDEATILSIPPVIEAKLAEYLPNYMVPSVFFCVHELPMTATGKINRRQVREIGGTFSIQQLAEAQAVAQGAKRQPTTALEQQLQTIWSQVLHIDPATIGPDVSFFQLGGDSIIAMQVASKARSSSIHVQVVDILREKTISNLARLIEAASSHNHSLQKLGSKSYPLAPAQNLFVHMQPDPTVSFDQFFHFRLREAITPEALSSALETIVRRHDVLRVRFMHNEEGLWEQRISDDVSGSFALRFESSADSGKTSDVIAQSRERLDITKGPVLSAVLSDDAANSQTLFLVAHRLVVDLASWHVILQELEEELVAQRRVTAPPSIDFLAWTALQAHYASENLKPDTSMSSDAQDHLSYWGMDSFAANVRGGIVVKEFVIDKTASSLILGSCNDAFKTRPLELMMSALIYSFGRVFSDRLHPFVFSEGHGREPWSHNIPVSRTVGCFSTIFPVRVAAGANTSFKDIIGQTKDCIRSLPRNGWSYFTSRFASDTDATRFAKEFPIEILFRYADLYQQLESSDGLFEQIDVPGGCDPLPSSLDVKRLALFDINMRVNKGRIVASVEFHKDMRHQKRILSWIGEFEAALAQLANELSNTSPDWTLSDFPLAFGSYDNIREFRDTTLAQLKIRPDDVEDIFPCSPMQEGILMAQAKDPTCYQRWTQIEIQVNGEGASLDRARLLQAWDAVVKRHVLLRSILIDTFPGSSRAMNVVLRDPAPSISWPETQQEAAKIRGLQKHGLQYHLTISDFDGRKARLRFEMNHAITDAFSHIIMCGELQAAYNGSIADASGSYKDFVTYLEEQPDSAGNDFWAETLADVEPCYIPAAPASSNVGGSKPVDVPDLDPNKLREFCGRWNVTPATVIELAWALVLNMYTGTAAPCFGKLFSGRDVPIQGVDAMLGPLIGLVPCCVRLDKSKSVLNTLKQAQSNYLSTLPYEHFPLAEIHRALGLGSRALFNTFLSFVRVGEQEENHQGGLSVKQVDNYDPTEFAVTINVIDSTTRMDIGLSFRPGCLTLGEVTRLANCLSEAISEITLKPLQPISELSLLGKPDLEQIMEWNGTVPDSVDQCVHATIERIAKSQPNAPAVCAWDGELTYAQLDRLATGLASRLVSLGVKSEKLVPLCFEKSLWTPVSMLAVLKAGGAFVLLDSSLPEKRLQTIVSQVGADIILSSMSNLALSSRLCKKVVQVSANSIRSPRYDLDPRPQPHSPSNAMYTVFTSGSTGTPKGVVLTHANFSSSLKYQAKLHGFTKYSRVFDFASYAFDVAVHNTFATFATGGCLCIPSDADRRDNVEKAMTSMRATLVELTPSVARLIDPAAVPSLETLIFIGEAATPDDAARWWGHVNVVNGYGPAECTVYSTVNSGASNLEEALHIGKGAGQVTWIVDPQNHNCLVPLGCVGELLLEGPLVGRGYINEPEKTAAVFIKDPVWLLQLGRHGILYKTGDLVQYNEDGNLVFIGRKDIQVKIHGQRVELGEVEHHIRECIPEAEQVIAEIIMPGGNKASPTLAVFLQMETKVGDEKLSLPAKILPLTPWVNEALAQRLPAYMIPTICFSIQKLPVTATGKTDRKRLREFGASFSAQQLAEMQTASELPKRQPILESERLMQKIWAEVIGISIDSIGLDDGFFQLGGDSISAMRVVAEARNNGFELAVADIFQLTKLHEIAKALIAED